METYESYKLDKKISGSSSLSLDLSAALPSEHELSNFLRSSRDRCSTTPAPMESPRTLIVVRKRSLQKLDSDHIACSLNITVQRP